MPLCHLRRLFHQSLPKKKAIQLFLLLLIVTKFVLWPPALAEQDNYEIEHQLHDIFSSLARHQPSAALNKIDGLLDKYPNFGLLHLLKAESLSVLAHQSTLMVEPAAMQKRRIEDLWSEAQSRLAYRPPPEGQAPESILRLSSRHEHVLIFSAAEARLFLFSNHNGVPRYLKSFYASIGHSGLGKSREGDNKTPLGVYYLLSHINKERLPSLYGDGAYPMNYPNAWDKRHGRQGSGIWLHGVVPSMYSRPPRDSRGCIVVSNVVLRALKPYIKIGSTPVVVLQKMTWLPLNIWQQRQQSMLRAFLQWQRDWESLDVHAYLGHYSSRYSSERHSYQAMLKQTIKNSKAKTYIKVDATNIDIFQYPNELELAMVVFNQNYQSNNYNVRYRKQQFWQKEDNWKIVYEGRAESVQP